MKKALIGLVVVAIGVALAIVLWPVEKGEHPVGPDGTQAQAGPAAEGGPAAKSGPGPSAKAPPPPSARGPAAALIEDDDPEGDLQLEGQVLDQGGLPVEGASVSIDTRPGRTAKTGRDGSFAFDKLIGRRYRLTARKDANVAGPLVHKLSETSDPAILRLRLGAEVEIHVTAKATGKPVAGAVVELRTNEDLPALTDSGGVARIQGVAGGYSVVHVEATGFAPAQQMVMVPVTPGTEPVRVNVSLKGGARVSGQVVDEAGAPVAGARVLATDTAALFDLQSGSKDGAVTDAQGAFELPALAAGTYRLVASHDEYPQASSETVTTDGAKPVAGVRIVMAAGGRLSGRVVDDGGSPVPWASVRVGTRAGSPFSGRMGGGMRRGATTEEDGTFEIKGLPREKLLAVAVGEGASSAAAEVDLAGRPAVEDLELRLSVTGRILGRVVTSAGEPVPEVQVHAIPDFWSQGVDEDIRLRGRTSTMTDGAGQFELKGLKDGLYRLRASRSGGSLNRFMRAGVQAHTGDEDVELTLDADGGLRGRVQFTDGGVPESFSVAVGVPPGVGFTGGDGAFELPEVPTGTHEVTVRGVQFADAVVPGVRVEPGQVTDLGAIKVTRGRTVTGRVLEPDGSVVPGATVVLARQLVGDGTNLTLELGAGAEEQMGVRRTTSDSDGAFRIGGVGDEELVMVAEHPDKGRSLPAKVPAGASNPVLDLTLHGFGQVSGRVTSGGQPVKGAMVNSVAVGKAEQVTIIHAGEDGTYRFEKLPAGEQRISAMEVSGMGMGSRSESRLVTVRAGEEVRVDIDLPKGQVELTVMVQGLEGAEISAAQVLLMPGTVTLTKASELTQVAASSGGGMMAGFWMPARPAVFKEVISGAYSVCVIPISGDMHDPAFAQKLQKNRLSLDVHCKPLTIEATPDKQTYTAVVPPMSPLPDEPPAEPTPAEPASP